MELVVISAGIGFINPELNWPEEKATIDVNVTGFAALANVAFRHFEQMQSGHLVGISSIAALRGSRIAPAYSALKAFVSNYMEGLRFRAAKAGLPILVTDVQPGFVDTAMAKGESLFWVASPQEAAKQIYRAIQRRARHAYVTRRWRLFAWLFKVFRGIICGDETGFMCSRKTRGLLDFSTRPQVHQPSHLPVQPLTKSLTNGFLTKRQEESLTQLVVT